jgi:hypothetical protein
MNGINKSTETTFAFSMQEWRMRGVLDYDQNGQPDILIEQDGTGRRGIWAMKDLKIEYGFIFTTVAPNWRFPIQ